MGKYKRIYLGVGSTLAGLFLILTMVGFQITSDGDKTCAGTEEDPCISYLTFYNPTAKSVYIYNYNEVKLDFSPEIERYELYVKYYGKWVYTNFTMETRLGNIPKDRKYVFVFPRYSTKKFKLVGYKINPTDTVKWGIGVLDEYLDPVWLPSMIDCKNKITYWNETVFIYANKTGYRLIPYNISCHTPPVSLNSSEWCNISYKYLIQNGSYLVLKNKTNCIRDGIVRVGEKTISYEGRWCVVNKADKNRVDCVSYNGGLHLPDKESFTGCQKEGGMDCFIHIFEDATHYNLSSVNSEKYVRGKTKVIEKELEAVKI